MEENVPHGQDIKETGIAGNPSRAQCNFQIFITSKRSFVAYYRNEVLCQYTLHILSVINVKTLFESDKTSKYNRVAERLPVRQLNCVVFLMLNRYINTLRSMSLNFGKTGMLSLKFTFFIVIFLECTNLFFEM